MSTLKKAQKLAAKPTFKSFSIIREDLLAIERAKMVVHLNKPIYTGFAVLELSKLHMYQFHYRYVFSQSTVFFQNTFNQNYYQIYNAMDILLKYERITH